nr:DNA helicase [Tanacetum cinerariifolium]
MKTKRKLVPKDVVMGNVGEPKILGVTSSCVSHVGEGSRPSVPVGSQLECLVGRVVDGRHMGNINDAGLCSAGNVIDDVGCSFHVDEFIGTRGLQTLGTSLNDTRKRSRHTTTVLANTDGNGCSSSKSRHTSVDHTVSHLRTSNAVFVPSVDPLFNTASYSHLHVPNERNPTQDRILSANRKRTRDVMSRMTTSNVGSSSSSTRRRLHSGRHSANTYVSNDDSVFLAHTSNVHTKDFSLRGNRTSPPLEYKDVGKCDHSCEHCGARFCDKSGLRRDIVEGLIELLDNHNALVQLFRTARDMLGAIVYEPGPNAEMDFDIVIEQRIGQPQRASKLYPSYMALQFLLLFVYGEDGIDYIHDHKNDIRNDYLSGIYYAIKLGDSDGSDCGGRLILPQSFTGGPRYMYAHYLYALAICRVHGNPTYFITFTCNVKWPEITDYIVDFPGVTTADRADIVDRVFEMRIHQFVKYLRDSKPFGNIIEIVYTVEFQKRDLPHHYKKYRNSDKSPGKVIPSDKSPGKDKALVWIDKASRTQNQKEIDNYISAELPSEKVDPEGHRVIAEFMIHGPCGEIYPTAACMKNNSRCTKHFPKEYYHNTYIDAAGFVHYRRRDTRITTTKQNIKLDNGYVVPYNLQLLKTFYAHINVEHCGWTMLIKYPFKYISKGTDKIAARITRNDTQNYPDTSSTSRQPQIVIDEIKNYLDSRYIGPHEACWRLFKFDIHYQNLLFKYWQSTEKTCSVTYGREKLQSRLLGNREGQADREAQYCQRNIFNIITHAVTTKTQELIFVYGHGGTGKTFLWKTIIYALRAEGKIVLAVASSAIVSFLLPSGRTTHSRFKLPLDLNDSFVCSITKNTQLATLLKETDLIVWDESPMNDRHCFETFDRTHEISLALCFDRKYAPHPRNFIRHRKKVSTFAEWLLNVGNRTLDDENGITKLINFIYDEHTLLHPTAKDLQDKAIVCPKNDTAYVINAKIMNMLLGHNTTYISNDEVMPYGHDGGEVELLYPTEYLNTLNFASIPSHELNLKIGTPIMLLRNINIVGCLCNGRRMIIRQLLPKVIEAQIITGTRISQKAYIPRIPLTMKDPKLPFIFKRKQFPVRGTPIQANMGLRDAEYFDQLLQLQKAYRFTGFSCEPTDKWECTLPTETSLIFGRFLQVEEILTIEFPEHYFNFAAFNELQDRMNAHNPILTKERRCDVKPKNLRVIEIENLSGNVIGCTLWNEMATNFDERAYNSMEKPVIIAVSSSYINHYHDMPSTFWKFCYPLLFGSNIPETRQIKELCTQLPNTGPMLEIVHARYEDMEREKMRNLFPLAILHDVDPQNYQRVRFTTEAVIYNINTQRRWYYQKCSKCGQKLKEERLVSKCKDHGPQTDQTYR